MRRRKGAAARLVVGDILIPEFYLERRACVVLLIVHEFGAHSSNVRTSNPLQFLDILGAAIIGEEELLPDEVEKG